MPSYSRKQFMREYEMKLDKEFEFDGMVASWAPGYDGPRFWGQEDASIVLDHSLPNEEGRDHSSAALTPDGRFLAVSVNATIAVYSVEDLARRTTFIGHERGVEKLFFALKPDDPSSYLLVATGGYMYSREPQFLLWHIDHDGKLSKEIRTMPFAIESMADKAIHSLEHDLETHHEVDGTVINAIREGFVKTLRRADAMNRIKSVPKYEGTLPGFGTSPISHRGDKMLYISHPENTQGGMRPPDELPQIVVLDVATHQESCVLKHHEDAIMWAGWSLDDQTIATASWDKTYKIWDAQTGECRHTIGKTGGQNWSGGFLPDGRHVLLSGTNNVAIYNVESGQKVADFTSEIAGTKLDHWMRYFAIHPSHREDENAHLIVFQNSRTLLAWRPPIDDNSSQPQVQEILALSRDEENPMRNSFGGIYNLKWADEGRKLLAQTSENTTFVWDQARGLKWRFQRPKGEEAGYDHDVFLVKREGKEWAACLDGDGKVRFWRL